MPRVKIPRKSTAIDMTAMCDVAFLLLTFFILTAKPKVEDPVPVDTPASTAQTLLPESDIATLTIGGKGKVFFGVEGFEVRKQLLLRMGDRYKISFTPSEVNKFSVMPNIGVPIAQVKQYLSFDGDQMKEFKAPGIPTDSVSNELFNWIYEARVVTKNISGKELRVTIKGDSQEEYPTIQKIIAILQKQEVNKFSLITSLRGKE
ncbi:biopolymer transporter ExbD [uncultured Mucilaginibacter sp.]|uniref:ExbD/TolR family protein n=1 Tax=uncultured Mucilaginibacter sp. TaxID=797541 RepID=UPI0025D82981|nr:biopolymer transporter ExbD [uncultured Mucilaginibacter sp.]